MLFRCLTALLVILTLSACHPRPPRHHGPPVADGEAGEQQTIESMQRLKQQLQELKEELARVRSEQAAAAAGTAARHPVWAPLAEGADAAPGFARYAYLLLDDQTPPESAIALLTLFETLPGPGNAAPGNRTLFLVPLRDAGRRLSLDNYDAAAAATLRQPRYHADGTGPWLLLSATRDAAAPVTLTIDLAGLSAPRVKQILQQLLRPVAAPATDPAVLLRQTCWQLADLDPERPTRIVVDHNRLALSFVDE
ncbi:hypothetical protein C2E25_15715 [Geothermobacter hydrogeniphilus]|uniref:Lipoprotein n=1 Tax=Geothermobacter hydrogeniphilus TaxID=1969733 RepID=A0A2K2H6E7_9BACT|nr:hypothetical protein [Geothermobacter hydrogeniphilus]PNU18819.1 hypothetical protein C2E25_15715 [Geothermobacter hydrogeniphilus]